MVALGSVLEQYLDKAEAEFTALQGSDGAQAILGGTAHRVRGCARVRVHAA